MQNTNITIKNAVTHSTREEVGLSAKGIVIVRIGDKAVKVIEH